MDPSDKRARSAIPAGQYGLSNYSTDDSDIEEFDVNLAAAQVLPVAMAPRFLELIEVSSDVLEYKFGNRRSFQRLRKGIKLYPRGKYSQIVLRNPSAGVVTGTIMYGEGDAEDGRLVVAGTGTLPVNVQNTSLVIEGEVAHGVAVVDNPVLVGTEALSAERAAVATGRMSRLVADLLGALVIRPHALPGDAVRASVQLVAAGATDLVAAIAAKRFKLCSLIVSNGGVAADEFQVLDGATVLFRGWVPIKDSRQFVFDVPEQTTINTALRVNIGGASADMRFRATGFQAAI